jgi:hypothetical protein
MALRYGRAVSGLCQSLYISLMLLEVYRRKRKLSLVAKLLWIHGCVLSKGKDEFLLLVIAFALKTLYVHHHLLDPSGIADYLLMYFVCAFPSCTIQCLPATAQVAAQEGEFLAHVLNVANLTASYDGDLLLPPLVDKKRATLVDSVTAFAMSNDKYVAPFQFFDMGILAYTGVSFCFVRSRSLVQLIGFTNNFLLLLSIV